MGRVTYYIFAVSDFEWYWHAPTERIPAGPFTNWQDAKNDVTSQHPDWEEVSEVECQRQS